MNAPTKIETQVASNDIVAVVTQEPQIVLLDQAKFDQFYEKMKAETDKLEPDVSTQKGRDEIRSMAFRVTRSKTAIDNAAKGLTEEWRAQTAKVNEQRKVIVGRLDALADEVRKPLTDWEEAEKTRVAECRAVIEGFRAASVVTLDDTADAVRQRGSDVYKTDLDADRFGDMLAEAQNAKDDAVRILQAALARLTKEEADRAELERLRAENEAREAKEREEAEARERAEREAEEARLAEQRRLDAEKAEAERIAQVEREAAERARVEAEQAAEAERQRVAREHEEQLAAERRRAEEAERAAQAERDRVAAAEAARIAEEKRIASEQAQREADRAHRGKIMGEAKAAIMEIGVDEPTAKNIVLAIVGGSVPHVSLRF
jgi:hypothetical protein